jgi:hypothetical protein
VKTDSNTAVNKMSFRVRIDVSPCRLDMTSRHLNLADVMQANLPSRQLQGTGCLIESLGARTRTHNRSVGLALAPSG